MTLMLHAGAKEVDTHFLRQMDTPAPTGTHYPIPHHRVCDLVKHSLTFYGHEVVEEHHAVTEDGMRYFGLISLRSNYGNYTDTVGLRNSSDKSFPVGVSFGSRVFVCDNLAFSGDQVIKRKHTQRLKFELPGLIAAIVEPLQDQRQSQAKTFTRYKDTLLTDAQVDHLILTLYREHVINIQRVPDVMREWDNPSFEGYEQPSIWRLFNAVTFALAGRVADNPSITSRLHEIMDAVAN